MQGLTLRAVVVIGLWTAGGLAQAGTIGGDHPFGLGVGIGLPTAITGKLYLGGDANALDFQLGAWGGSNYNGYDNVYLHVVYLWHPSIVTEGNNFEMPWHVGVGGALWEGGYCGWGNSNGWDNCSSSDVALAARVPVGLDFNIQDPRIQIFGDIAVNVLVFPGIALDLGLQIGARYYF